VPASETDQSLFDPVAQDVFICVHLRYLRMNSGSQISYPQMTQIYTD